MRKGTQPDKIRLDPIFQIPPGAENVFTYTRDNADTTATNDSNDDLLLLDDTVFDESVTDADSTELGVPDDFSIIKETIKRTSGGNMVIDVVIAIDDVPGADDYEIQVVKV